MREKWINALIRLTLERRWIIWCVTVILTVLMFWAGKRIVLDVRWSALLPESDPKVEEYKKIDQAFLQPGNLIVAVSGFSLDNTMSLVLIASAVPSDNSKTVSLVDKNDDLHLLGDGYLKWKELIQ